MKKLTRAVVFGIIVIFCICHVYKILSWKDTTGAYLSATQQLYATEDGLIDLVFMGSSHCYCGINPSVLWDTYGISAFDMAISGQDKSSTYHTLKELLKTQSPKVVCIDMWGLVFEEHGVESNVYRNMLSMKTSANSIDLVQSYIEKEEQADYILRWPIVHTRYRELQTYDFVQNELSIYGRGFFCNYHATPVSGIATSVQESVPLSDSNKKWIDDLKQLSEEEGFTLVMFLAPNKLPEDEQMIIKGAEEYLEELKIACINYNDLIEEVGFDYNTDFTDESHLNTTGANKLTSYFGEYLTANYDFEDHRGDEAYYLWDECSVYMEHKAYQEALKSTKDAWQYFTKLAESEDITVIISLDGTYQDSTLELMGFTELFGIPTSEYYLGGKWIYENGEILYYMNSGMMEEYNYDLNERDTLRIWNQLDVLNRVQINGEPMNGVYNGLSVTVYDKFTGEIVDQRGYF
ncbi:MAG: hypothetical protein IJ397_00340 [Lachnospiraceae bacterium]|nr:hypothetical protein [Lachnospiraceae bacterium]